jgi:fructose-bisphosphate aldolase class I
MDGAHDIDRCDEVTRWILQTTFQELYRAARGPRRHRAEAEHGRARQEVAEPAPVQQVAERTIAALKATVPSAVPGIAYLSGGQSDEEATAHLDAMNKIGGFPWKMTFSYGRALQAAPQKAWSGRRENVRPPRRPSPTAPG